jgi:hypothetical protein
MSIRYIQQALGIVSDDQSNLAQIMLNLSKELRKRAELLDSSEDLETAKK